MAQRRATSASLRESRRLASCRHSLTSVSSTLHLALNRAEELADLISRRDSALPPADPSRSRRPHRICSIRERQRVPLRAPSLAAQREPDDVSLCLEPLDAVHQLVHEEKSATIFAENVLRSRRVGSHRGEVESRAFVHDVEDELVIVDHRANADVSRAVVPVAAQDGVRDRLRERNTHVQRAFVGRNGKLATLPGRELYHAFDVPDVAWYLDVESDAGLTHQKLSSARSRVSEIWKRVSSLVSSKSVCRSSFRLARRSSPPCSRIFFDNETRTPSPELSMYPVWLKSMRNFFSPFSSSSRTFCL